MLGLCLGLGLGLVGLGLECCGLGLEGHGSRRAIGGGEEWHPQRSSLCFGFSQ